MGVLNGRGMICVWLGSAQTARQKMQWVSPLNANETCKWEIWWELSLSLASKFTTIIKKQATKKKCDLICLCCLSPNELSGAAWLGLAANKTQKVLWLTLSSRVLMSHNKETQNPVLTVLTCDAPQSQLLLTVLSKYHRLCDIPEAVFLLSLPQNRQGRKKWGKKWTAHKHNQCIFFVMNPSGGLLPKRNSKRFCNFTATMLC